MAKGISVHVGVNRVNAPGISVPDLRGCENDARAMYDIAHASGFISPGPILSEEATFDRVITEIESAAAQLSDGDIFLFTFSGHGTRHGTDDIDEVDYKDECLVLHDRILVDNVFRRQLWPKFKAGVRVLAISDSCYGGGVFLIAEALHGIGVSLFSPFSREIASKVAEEVVKIEISRTIPEGENQLHFNYLRDFYAALRESLPSGPAPPLSASLLLIGACKEFQQAADGPQHGAFTQALLSVWNTGPQDYQGFVKAIKQQLAGRPQEPVLTAAPQPNLAFLAQRPFTI